MAVPDTATGPSLTSTLGTIVPTWLGNVPGLRYLYSLLFVIAKIGDMLREIALEGRWANWPGIGTPTANPLIAATRGLVQGPTEPNAAFASRSIGWLAAVKQMGNAEGLVREIQAFLCGQGSLGAGVYPVVIFIDRAGNQTTANADLTVTESKNTAWRWDGLGGWVDAFGYNSPATVAGFWSDGWLIIQDPYTHYTGFTDANWLAAWNSGDQTVDSLTPQTIVSGIEAIIDFWKSAHIWIRCAVWCPAPATFVSTPTPNGYWGGWGFDQGGTYAPERTVAFSYWEAGDGSGT